MLKLRKIPLEPLIQILQDLYDSGADYIDLSGEQNKEEDELKDIIQITVKPEYMTHTDNDDDNDITSKNPNDDCDYFYEYSRNP